MDKVHYTWAGTFVLEAAVFLCPDINFILTDADCIPLALYEVKELANLAAVMFPERKRDPARGVVLLVSEPHAEINAGWICVGARHQPRPEFGTDYKKATTMLFTSRKRFALSSRCPDDASAAAQSGPLVTPLLGWPHMRLLESVTLEHQGTWKDPYQTLSW